MQKTPAEHAILLALLIAGLSTGPFWIPYAIERGFGFKEIFTKNQNTIEAVVNEARQNSR